QADPPGDRPDGSHHDQPERRLAEGGPVVEGAGDGDRDERRPEAGEAPPIMVHVPADRVERDHDGQADEVRLVHGRRHCRRHQRGREDLERPPSPPDERAARDGAHEDGRDREVAGRAEHDVVVRLGHDEQRQPEHAHRERGVGGPRPPGERAPEPPAHPDGFLAGGGTHDRPPGPAGWAWRMSTRYAVGTAALTLPGLIRASVSRRRSGGEIHREFPLPAGTRIVLPGGDRLPTGPYVRLVPLAGTDGGLSRKEPTNMRPAPRHLARSSRPPPWRNIPPWAFPLVAGFVLSSRVL